MSEHYDMIVIGAGISGLAMAFTARQAGKRVLVVEKSNRAGGCFHSEQYNATKHPFWLEMGTHTCFNSYGRLLKLLDQLGMTDQMQARTKLPYRMLADDKLVSIPSRLHIVELLTHAWRIFSANKSDKSVADYYQSITGPKNYHEVFRHAFNAVICQPASDVPADMLFRKRPRDKNIMRSYSFPTGLEDIIHALEAELTILKDMDIQSIQRTDDGYQLRSAEHSWQCDTLVCATPVLGAARLLRGVHPDIAEQLEWIGEVEIETVGIVVDKNSSSVEPLAGLIAADGNFYSAVSRDIIDHPDLRGFTFHFKPGLLDDEQKLQHICQLLAIDSSDLRHVCHKGNRLPSPAMGHHQLVAGIDEQLAGKPLALVGNYFAGVAIEDCLERVEQEFKRINRSTS